MVRVSRSVRDLAYKTIQVRERLTKETGKEPGIEEIAKELGVYETVKRDGGWQNVSSKDCGNIVTKAIEIANRKVQ